MKHPRIAISALTLSAASLIGLAVSEGYSDRAIIPTKGDVPTIGFGTTTRPDGSPVQMGDRTNPVEALQRKQRDLVKFEGALKQCVRVPLHQQPVVQHRLERFLWLDAGAPAQRRSTTKRPAGRSCAGTDSRASR